MNKAVITVLSMLVLQGVSQSPRAEESSGRDWLQAALEQVAQACAQKAQLRALDSVRGWPPEGDGGAYSAEQAQVMQVVFNGVARLCLEGAALQLQANAHAFQAESKVESSQ